MGADGTVIWLDDGGQRTHFLKQGDFSYDEFELARLISYFDNGHPDPCRVQLGSSGVIGDEGFQDVGVLLLAPISIGGQLLGWINTILCM